VVLVLPAKVQLLILLLAPKQQCVAVEKTTQEAIKAQPLVH
jgi:hypothetical protein